MVVERLPRNGQAPTPCQLGADLLILVEIMFCKAGLCAIRVARIGKLVDLASANSWVKSALHHTAFALDTDHLTVLDDTYLVASEVHQDADAGGKFALRVWDASGIVGD